MNEKMFSPLNNYKEFPSDIMLNRSSEFLTLMKSRRSVRQFSSRAVDKKLIENCLMTASTAPSGANMQPWHFAVVSNPEIKKQIRFEAEKVEHEFYHGKAPVSWLKELEPLGTDDKKEYLEIAPYLIVIFAVRHTVTPDGSVRKHYYLSESVGIATGMLITAIHNSGLVCLTHTPSPMGFLRDVLNRPKSEKPYLLLAVGYPDEKASLPNISKKTLEDISTFI